MSTRDDMLKALRNAHNAGDTQAARRIAAMIKQADVSTPGQPSQIAQQIARLPPQAQAAQRREIATRMQTQAFGVPSSEPLFQALSPGAQRMPSATDVTAPDAPLETAFIPTELAPALFTGLARQIPISMAKRAAKRYDWMDEVVKPYWNKAARKDALDQMEVVGLLQKKVFPTTNEQKEMIKALKTVVGVSKRNIDSKHYVVIRDHLKEAADDLQKKLDKMPLNRRTRVRQRDIELTLRKAAKNVNESYVKSQRMDQTEIDTYIDNVMDWIKADKIKTPGDLLRARKAIDDQFRTYGNQRRMDPANALIPSDDEIKWRNARDSLNSLLEWKAPGTKKELRRQSMLYKTRDVLKDKAEYESNTFFRRSVAPRIPFTKKDVTTTIIPKVTQ